MADSEDRRRLRTHDLGPPFAGRPGDMPVDVEMAGYDMAIDQLVTALIEMLVRRGVLSLGQMYDLFGLAKSRIPIEDLIDANAQHVLTDMHADLINATADLDPDLLRRFKEKFPERDRLHEPPAPPPPARRREPPQDLGI